MGILTPPAIGSKPSDRFATSRITSLLDAWRLLAWIGLAFVVMGGTDVVLAWYPAPFGNAEWEFGAIAATLNGIALPTLGFYFLLASAVARDQQLQGRIVGTVLLVLALGLAILAFVYATVVPVALNAVASNAEITAGMRKAVVKAVILFIVYVALLAGGGVQGWRVRGTS